MPESHAMVMPNSRVIALSVAFSVLLHMLIATLAAVIPWNPRKAEDVMVVALSDLPRSPDFLPPKAGILKGGRLAPPPARRPEELPKAHVPDLKPPPVMEGRVPDLPVNPALPPEARFEARGPQARATEPPPSAAPPPGAPAGPRPSGGSAKSLKDITPTLGRTVIAMGESGRRGRGDTAGGTVASGGKAKERGDIVEMGGSGATLTALNAPEIQYISYFAGIKRKIELVWGYPPGAAGLGGEVVVDFVVGRSGRLESVNLLQGSGYRILDEEALNSIRKAAPYDPIPKEYKIANLQIRAHFIYSVTTILR